MPEGRVTGKWVRVAALTELPTEGLGHSVKAEGLDIALFRWNDRVYAIEDLCPHLGFPLSEGIMQAGEVICSWHGWHVRPRTGTRQSLGLRDTGWRGLRQDLEAVRVKVPVHCATQLSHLPPPSL